MCPGATTTLLMNLMKTPEKAFSAYITQYLHLEGMYLLNE
jgi:hypothetical protein